MANYIVNRRTDSRGFHEVHNLDAAQGCLPNAENRIALGVHYSCQSAVASAKANGYTPADGCFYCAYACHSG